MSLKSKIFEKLDDAVENADANTVNGVQILALSASTVKNLSDDGSLEDDIYSIGVAGELGFGVATCPQEYIPGGWRGLPGHDNIISENYGNYVDTNGSILVYIPKHYYKYDGNTCLISHRALSGYVIDRAFINANREMNGIFVYKYGGCNDGGIFASKPMRDPVSTNSDHNGVANINGCSENNYGELYTAVKSAGSRYFLAPIFVYSMLARLAFAHGKAATNNVSCAFRGVDPKMPKGCLNNALADYNDPSVVFASSGYSNCALTGSGEPFAKTTHNGQDSGIADLTGNMWEVASGFIALTSSGADSDTLESDDFLTLKESVDIASITDDGTGATGAYNPDLYDQMDLSGVVDGNDGWTYLGNESNAVFGMNTDRSSKEYRRTMVGIGNDEAYSSSGTTEFGNDGLYRYLRNEMACRCGGAWSYGSNAGVFAMYLANSRTDSNDAVGGRACVLV